jgi:hypothetical protein
MPQKTLHRIVIMGGSAGISVAARLVRAGERDVALADYWRQQGVLNDIGVVLVLPTPDMFGVPVFAKEVERVAAGYGIEVQFNFEVVEVDAGKREILIKNLTADTKDHLSYDVMHLVPPQSAPDWLKAAPLADPANPNGRYWNLMLKGRAERLAPARSHRHRLRGSGRPRRCVEHRPAVAVAGTADDHGRGPEGGRSTTQVNGWIVPDGVRCSSRSWWVRIRSGNRAASCWGE